jgi:hypothetical protein
MPTFNKVLEFDRNQILNRYWELANLDEVQTKGTITGQLKALDSLCEELAPPGQPKPAAKRAPAHEIYRAAWMPEQIVE